MERTQEEVLGLKDRFKEEYQILLWPGVQGIGIPLVESCDPNAPFSERRNPCIAVYFEHNTSAEVIRFLPREYHGVRVYARYQGKTFFAESERREVFVHNTLAVRAGCFANPQ